MRRTKHRGVALVFQLGDVLGGLADGFADEVAAGGQEAVVAEAVEQQEVAHDDVAQDLREGAGRVLEAVARRTVDGRQFLETLVALGGLAEHV